MNVVEDIYLNALLTLYGATSKLPEDTDIGITKEMYKEKMNLVALSVDPSNGSNFLYLGVQRFGHTHLNIKIKEDLKNP